EGYFTVNQTKGRQDKDLVADQGKPQQVQYKQNRCVIFDSALYHATNKVRFKKGFTNRRINLTFLAGFLKDTCAAAEARSQVGRAASKEHLSRSKQ
ncbi:unnamed protein product, partial [Polarella glacialis]